MSENLKNTIIKIWDVSKSFDVGTQKVKVLKGITFNVKVDDFLVIFGPSGCGKSTLLHTILGLEEPSSGYISYLGKDIYENAIEKMTTEDERADFRKLNVGMVYQQANWIKSLNVWENVAFPLTLLGIDKEERKNRALETLKEVDIFDWANYIPMQLSSGQQQKVALARALISNPRLIIADEPTGNLDFDSGQELMKLLTKLNIEKQKTIIMVTHDLEYLKYAKTTVKMFDGQISGIYDGKEEKLMTKKIKGKRKGSINE